MYARSIGLLTKAKAIEEIKSTLEVDSDAIDSGIKGFALVSFEVT